MTTDPRVLELEILLYGCLVEFSNGDEDDGWYRVYDQAWKSLGLPERMPELKKLYLATKEPK